MILRTSGKPLKATMKECKLALKFAANVLMSQKMLENISIKLIFSEEETRAKGWFGYCDWKDDNLRPREFDIGVDPNLPRAETLKTILHEVVHIKQFATGQLRDFVRADMKDKVIWMGRQFRDDRGNNTFSPWECEARRLEKVLYRQFKELTR